MDRVVDQARRFRVTLGRELARLVIHGALHLAGLEHRTVAERRRMRAREARLLKAGATHVLALEKALDPPEPRPGSRKTSRRKTPTRRA